MIRMKKILSASTKLQYAKIIMETRIDETSLRRRLYMLVPKQKASSGQFPK